MCGIVGFSGASNFDKLKNMSDSIFHRGPDESGFFSDDNINLGMRRLSIIDIKGGHQPFKSANGRYVLVFNGEIYNYIELKKELELEGIKFETSSDTEVLFRCLETRGLSTLAQLRGMFAFAWYDTQEKELLLVRDRFGKKPLYYSLDKENNLVFSSELQSFKNKLQDPKLSHETLKWYFSQKTSSISQTIFEEVKKLEAGHYLVWKKDDIKIKKYYDLPKFSRLNSDDIKYQDAQIQFEELLKESTRIRMRSDVPVGSFLSGGVDSSLLTKIAASFVKSPLHTYCLVYDESINNKDSDRFYSQKVANEISSIHHEVMLKPADLIEELPTIARHYFEPNCAVFSMWFLAKEMSKNIKVAISGDGADELFGSYFVPRNSFIIDELNLNPDTNLMDQLRKDEKTFVVQNQNTNFAEIVDRFSVFSSEEQNKLFSDKVLGDSVFNYIVKATGDVAQNNRYRSALAFDWKYLLTNQVLNYSDLLSMSHSLEVRAPFMDHVLVEYIVGLPDIYKIQPNYTKRLLKDVAKKYFPSEMIDRPKEGFVEPSIFWLSSSLKPLLQEYLLGENFNQLGLLNSAYVKSIYEKFTDNGDFYLGKKVWALLMYSIWENEVIFSDRKVL